MRNLMFIFTFLVVGTVAAFAQSSTLTVKNSTNCAVIVELVNEQDDCNADCTTTAICVLPGTTATINPCNPDWYWDRAIVTGAYDDCTPCTSTPVVVSSPEPTNCLNIPSKAKSAHCAGCDPFVVDFQSNTFLYIY